MYLFLIGDFKSNNGPGTANKAILRALQKKTSVGYSKANSKFARVFEIISGVFRAKKCLICSSSKSNYFVFLFSRILKKNVYYIMHGFGSYEYLVNDGEKTDSAYKRICQYERFVYLFSHKIICVSRNFMEDMKKNFPMCCEKFEYIYNIVDVKCMDKNSNTEAPIRKKGKDSIPYVLSTGGGMRRKNNLKIAKAINFLNEKYGMEINYIVVGPVLQEGDKLKQYKFVEYHEYLGHDEVLSLMKYARIYVQNSIYETFGLAVIEALQAGTSILISKNIGCCDLFENLEACDTILNEDTNEMIAEKLFFLIHNPNNARLLRCFRANEISGDSIANRIMDIISD